MRKRKQGRKLSLTRDKRNALLASLLRALVLQKKIRTTEAKAKELSRVSKKRVRVTKLGRRASDGAAMAVIELIE